MRERKNKNHTEQHNYRNWTHKQSFSE